MTAFKVWKMVCGMGGRAVNALVDQRFVQGALK